jgi:ABC-2 type transport system ATP-binding protein
MPEIVSTEGLGKRFGAVRALHGVTLRVDRPLVMGVLGPNGAGKTTLFAILTGLAAPSEGTARLFGEPLGRRYPRRRVGVVLQREAALEGMTARDYAELFAAIYRVRGGAAKILAGARLEARRDVLVETLSGGEAQRLFVAAACVHEPDLLLLDEPTAHLDPGNKRDLGRAVRAMAERRVVLLATHDLREAETLCDEVVFLVGGEVKAAGPPAALVEALPPGARHGRGLEDAFFHHAGARLDDAGELS